MNWEPSLLTHGLLGDILALNSREESTCARGPVELLQNMKVRKLQDGNYAP
jgi:hypothetical protein